jgi:hypothetical protein
MTVSHLSRQLAGISFEPKAKLTAKEMYQKGRCVLSKLMQTLKDCERADHDVNEQARQGNYDALEVLFEKNKSLEKRIFRVLASQSHMPFISKLLVDCAKLDDKGAVDYMVKEIESGHQGMFLVLDCLVEDGDLYARHQLERVLLKRDIQEQALWMETATYRARLEAFAALTNESPGPEYLFFYCVPEALRERLAENYSWTGPDWYVHFMEYISDEMWVELEMGAHFRQSIEESYEKPLCLAMQVDLARIVLENQKNLGFRDTEPVVLRSHDVLMHVDRYNSCVSQYFVG